MVKQFEKVPFVEFKKALQVQFETLKTLGDLYVVDVPKDELYDLYLDSFPEGTNEIYKERREYDCNCCKNFIRTAGRVVAIHNNKLVSLWDVQVGGYYQVVADALKDKIVNSKIQDRFFHFEEHTGTDKNVALLEDGKTKTWNHFYQVLPKSVVKKDDEIPSLLGKIRDQKAVLHRALTELALDAGETVLDLIAQGSLYRGDEQKAVVSKFINLKKQFDNLKTDSERDNFSWTEACKLGEAAKFRNNAIGTLLIDLSEGKDLEQAVRAWEVVVAPANYKRTSALVTPAMIKAAQDKVQELGLEESLSRRYAVTSDLTINNVLFADRSAKAQMNVFDQLVSENKGKPKSLDKVEEISIEDFIENVLPKVKTIEALVENRLSRNLVSLIAPSTVGATNMFKWDNAFSWSYNGDITDSDLRSTVQARGGSVSGVFRFSHQWNYDKRNTSLMDLHVFLPGSSITAGNCINDSYGNSERVGWNNRKHTASGGVQDVDYTPAAPEGYVPVENITFPSLSKMKEGTYVCKIHNWELRSPTQGGFKAEIEFGGNVYQYEYDKPLKHKEWITVAEVTLKNGIFTIKHHLPTGSSSKDVWGIKTENFQKVSLVLNSPNHWDGQTKGNKHYFFMLEGCANPESTRGFYNEYLRDELHEHRKVFEVLASKLKAEYTPDQLSGLGFSSTQRNELVVKVSGSFNRTLKIKF